jgi:cytoskeleton protein RodZ
MAIPITDAWCLASLRRSKGISLEEIAQRTKLRVTTLKAIEEGDFDALPGGIYNISYLRQFAREIGADESSVIQLYRQSCADPDSASTAESKA